MDALVLAIPNTCSVAKAVLLGWGNAPRHPRAPAGKRHSRTWFKQQRVGPAPLRPHLGEFPSAGAAPVASTEACPWSHGPAGRALSGHWLRGREVQPLPEPPSRTLPSPYNPYCGLVSPCSSATGSCSIPWVSSKTYR